MYLQIADLVNRAVDALSPQEAGSVPFCRGVASWRDTVARSGVAQANAVPAPLGAMAAWALPRWGAWTWRYRCPGQGSAEEACSMGDRRPVGRLRVRMQQEDFQWLAWFARQEGVSAAALTGHAVWLLRM